ncbi:MAG TPA: phosphatase PAP2 family protein [Galbitalea sp.]|nr:phosphatase PAP2 family protein [Galbitalea sp.]
MTHARAEARTAESRKGRNRFILTVVIVVVVVILVIVAGIALTHSSAETAAETQFLAQVAASRVGALVSVSLALNWVFSPPIALIVGLIATAGVFAVTRSWVTVLHFVLLVLGTWLSSEVVKLIVHRPRPTARLADSLVPNPDPDSYPSGHVCFAVGLGLAFFVLVIRSRVRVVVAVLAILLALITAGTRVYLGIHYPTDALASLVFGAAAFVGIEAIWRRYAGGIFRQKPAEPAIH